MDGPYIQEEHADLLWRGSANQRLLVLTDRYRAALPGDGSTEDRGVELEFRVGKEGTFHFTGVPAQAGFRGSLEAELARQGVRLGARG